MASKRIHTTTNLGDKTLGRGDRRGMRGDDGRFSTNKNQVGSTPSSKRMLTGYGSQTTNATRLLVSTETLAETSLVLRKQATLHLDMNPLRVESLLFEDEAEYERVTDSVVARIRSGEIQACEPEEDED